MSSTEQLLRASSDDEAALRFELPDSAFGFHAQQAVEKLYKAALAARTSSYPFIHDSGSLRKSLESAGITPPACEFRLENLSEYAGNARYDDPIPIDAGTREVMRRCVAKLREYVLEVVSQVC